MERTKSMRTPIDVVMLALPSASLMNVFGPAEAFSEANSHRADPVYRVRIISAGQQGASGCQEKLLEDWNLAELAFPVDTLLLAGGFAWPPRFQNGQLSDLLEWVRAYCPRARRFGGIGSGSMFLAEAGLLRRRQATTHWLWFEHMAARYPDVKAISDRIYVKDGNCYTAAGGASAIDLALSLVEEDLGTEVALDVAKRMVLFLLRPGAQPQLSNTLLAQTPHARSIGNLLVWMVDNLDKDLSVSTLARRVAMSTRNFARHFLREVGKTPARHVSDLRLEAGRRNLAHRTLSLAEVAKASGFSNIEAFRRLFTKTFGVSPGRYRLQEQHTPIAKGERAMQWPTDRTAHLT